MSRKHDLGYERGRLPVMRDDPEDARLEAEIHNLGLRIDALNGQHREVEKALRICEKRLEQKRGRLAEIRAGVE